MINQGGINVKKTKIIATMGPSSEQQHVFEHMIEAGVNIIRLNCSYGNYEQQLDRIKMIRDYRNRTKKAIAILLDIRGPEIRTQSFKGGQAMIQQGAQFILTTRDVVGTNTICSITYKGLPEDIKVGDKVLINDGIVLLEVKHVEGTEIVCVVLTGGLIRENARVKVPGVAVKLPSITQNDIEDIEFAINNGVDFIGASFVHGVECVQEIKQILKDKDATDIKVISKIGCKDGIDNLDAIIKESYGIIVARGELGLELPIAKVPIMQKRIIEKCNRAGRPVIIATHVLDSMSSNPMPTRAEVTDTANAIYDGADAVMLSGETANGKYPVLAVSTMTEIICAAEQERDYPAILEKKRPYKELGIAETVSFATCNSASDLGAKAIICPTNSGFTAGMVAKFRPEAPIFALVSNKRIQRAINLYSGVEPIVFAHRGDIEQFMTEAVDILKEEKFIEKDDIVLITAGLPYIKSKITNTMKVHVVD